MKGERDCWPQRAGLAIEDPFETFYDVGHVVKQKGFMTIQREFALAYSKIVGSVYDENDRPRTSRVDTLLDYICEVREQDEAEDVEDGN